MSLTAAIARVSELEALLASAAAGGPAQAPPATTATPGPGFEAQLEAAEQSGATGGLDAPGASVPGAPTPFSAEIDAAAARHRVDPAVLRGLIKQESNFNPRAVSPAGAKGLGQLMPGTAASLGVTNPFDPAQSINGAAKYLRQQLDRFGGDVRKALAAYNAGPGAVQRYGGIPPYNETQNYVRKVISYAEGYRRVAAPAAAAGQPGGLPYKTV